MQRISFPLGDKLAEPVSGGDSGTAGAAAGSATVVLPTTRAEYEQAIEELDTRGRSDETVPERVPEATTERPAYVATTDAQRRAWNLPDLAATDAAGRRPEVVVMPLSDAIRTLADGGPLGPDATQQGAVPPADPLAEGGDASSLASVVNLKEGRGNVPAALRGAFEDLSRRSELDGARLQLERVIDHLAHTTVPALEQSHRDIVALSCRSVIRQRACETCDANPVLGSGGHAAQLGWMVSRQLGLAEQAVTSLDLSALSDAGWRPSDIRSLLRASERGDDDAQPIDGIVEKAEAALRTLADGVSRLLDRLRRVVAARRKLERKGSWRTASFSTLHSLLRDLDAACRAIDDTDAFDGDLSAARDTLENLDKYWKSAGNLAAETQALVDRVEAADLPVPVLDTVIHELARSLTATYDSAAMLLDHVRLLIGLPWVRRASERVDLAAAMAGLDAAHVGCRRVKDRIRRFLAVRALHGTTWTVEGRGGAGEPTALVVRQPRAAAPSPILCFAGPPGCGKTSLARVIAQALGRPCVSVPLGGVWDESHIRGLPHSFRAAAPGQIVQSLAAANVRNPVVILDELDKVGGRNSQFGSPAAALLEVLDPAQNTRFVDHFVGLPVDLSEVLWIGTANYVDAMSPPLRDRMDVIEVAGYTDDEKVAIVKCHLETVTAHSGLTAASLSAGVPASKPRELTAPAGDSPPSSSNQSEVTSRRELPAASAASAGEAPATGGPPRPVEMTDEAIRAVIRGYTCESGVRNLLRLVGGLCEEVACRRVVTGDTGPVLIVADEGECSDARRRLVVDEVLGPPQHETLPDDVRDVIAREMSRVTAVPRADPEAARILDWVGMVTELPWNRHAPPVDVAAVKSALDRVHVGCGDQKERLLDHLAAGDADGRPGMMDVLPCLTGAPGVGKTALARSLATALGRGFVEVSLAGVGGADAIRGIDRSRSDAAPGCLVTGLRQLGVDAESRVSNPVVVLDGLDQLAAGPAAEALLDALDPLRNHAFRDRYLGLALDLSAVTWLATATDLDGIPVQLRDRLEVVPLRGYCEAEKLRIALEHLVPGHLTRHGLTREHLSLSPDAVRRVIRGHTRESGVKHLDQLLAAFVRRMARLGREEGCWPGEVGPEAVRAGLPELPFREGEFVDRTRRPGVAIGLAVDRAGGQVLVVEARCLPGNGAVHVTGTLGPMLRESATVALTWVREHAHRLPKLDAAFDRTDIHLHLPAAGHPKDGPSAGVTIVTALVSVLTGQPVRSGVAMTGEITLCGDVLPVSALEQKLLAAARSGMSTVLVPEPNRCDVTRVGDQLCPEIAVHYAASIEDVLNLAVPDVLVR